MTDDDDFITVNITKDQSAALVLILMLASQAGMVDNLPSDVQESFYSLVKMMTIEIERQKLNALGSN
jgi:hypothetical protein